MQGLANDIASSWRYRGGLFSRVGVLSALYHLQVELELCSSDRGACLLGGTVHSLLSTVYSNNTWNKKERREICAKYQEEKISQCREKIKRAVSFNAEQSHFYEPRQKTT